MSVAALVRSISSNTSSKSCRTPSWGQNQYFCFFHWATDRARSAVGSNRTLSSNDSLGTVGSVTSDASNTSVSSTRAHPDVLPRCCPRRTYALKKPSKAIPQPRKFNSSPGVSPSIAIAAFTGPEPRPCPPGPPGSNSSIGSNVPVGTLGTDTSRASDGSLVTNSSVITNAHRGKVQ